MTFNRYPHVNCLFEVIIQIRVGRLPPISTEHREELKLRGEAKHFNKLRAVLKSDEYLNVRLELSPISRKNTGEILFKLCNFLF